MAAAAASPSASHTTALVAAADALVAAATTITNASPEAVAAAAALAAAAASATAATATAAAAAAVAASRARVGITDAITRMTILTLDLDGHPSTASTGIYKEGSVKVMQAAEEIQNALFAHVIEPNNGEVMMPSEQAMETLRRAYSMLTEAAAEMEGAIALLRCQAWGVLRTSSPSTLDLRLMLLLLSFYSSSFYSS